jgi:hypothetical protein
MNTVPNPTPNTDESAYGTGAQPAPRNRMLLVAGLGVVALLALLGGGLLVVRSGQSASSNLQASSIAAKQAESTSTVSAASATGAAPTTSATGDTPAATNAGDATSTGKNTSTAGNSGAGNSTGNGNAAPTPAPAPKPTPAPKPAAPAPVITSFHTPDNIDCHNGNSQDFTASWTTTNATKVTISIDGPGIYKSYPANGSDSLPFTCTSAHSYKLTAFGQDGKTVTKTITLQPRNVQKPSSGQDDE